MKKGARDLRGTGIWAFRPPPVVDVDAMMATLCGATTLQYGTLGFAFKRVFATSRQESKSTTNPTGRVHYVVRKFWLDKESA